VTLLFGAGLLLRSFEELGRVSPGFEPTHILTMQVSGGWGETADMKRLTQRIDTTLNQLRALPGVEAAATAAVLPGIPSQEVEFVVKEGERDLHQKTLAVTRFVSSGYFLTTGIPIMLGEGCREGESAPAVLVNRTFAGRYLTQGAGVGSHLAAAEQSIFMPIGEIRGIVGDARAVCRRETAALFWQEAVTALRKGHFLARSNI